MPKSKRGRPVHLTKTQSRLQERKPKLVEDVQSSIDEYTNNSGKTRGNGSGSIYLFECVDMRAQHLKAVRSKFPDSRFFMGRNKVMKIALGRSKEEAYRDNLDQLSKHLSGDVGIFMTNRPVSDVESFFASFKAPDFARAGFKASKTVSMKQGKLPGDFPSSMFEQLRKLQMPVELDVGVLKLRQDFNLCTKGEILTPEQAQLLKLFGHQLAEFKIRLLFRWRDGEVTKLAHSLADPSKKNADNKSSKGKAKTPSKSDETEAEVDEQTKMESAMDLEEDEEEA